MNHIKRGIIAVTAVAVALSTVTFSGPMHIAADSTQEELEDKLDKISEQMEELEAAIEAAEGDIDREREKQEKIDEQITATEEYIRTLTDLIGDYNDQISELEDEISLKEDDITATEQLIAAQELEIADNISIYEGQLRAMYVSGGNDSLASVLLGSSDFFDMLMRMELIKRVADYNNGVIDNLHEILQSYEDNKLELENLISDLELDISEVEQKRTDVELLKADWDSQLANLNDLYEQSETQIELLRQQQQSYEDNKDELDEEAEEIEEEIQRIIREASREEYIGDLEPGTFLWPLPGYYQITSGYGSRWGTTHRGIDISGSGVRGAEITAANSGVVITVNNSCTHDYGKKSSCGCGGGFGNYCIIDHGGGYATLYGHAEEIIVEEGQHVTTGDVIGYVGSTGYSTGPHLHFEVRVDGERKDPESFNLIKY